MKPQPTQDIFDRFERWVQNHPEVWGTGEEYDEEFKKTGIIPTSRFWWVQNALGDIFGWGGEWVKFVSEISKKYRRPGV